MDVVRTKDRSEEESPSRGFGTGWIGEKHNSCNCPQHSWDRPLMTMMISSSPKILTGFSIVFTIYCAFI